MPKKKKQRRVGEAQGVLRPNPKEAAPTIRQTEPKIRPKFRDAEMERALKRGFQEV